MAVTASEVESLKATLGRWEWFEYASTGVVFIGCIGELIEEFTPWIKDKKKKHSLALLSLLLVIAGIAGELLGTVKTSQISGTIIANIEEEAGNAKTSADESADAAKRANTSAEAAELDAAQAEEYALLLGPRENLLVKERRRRLVSSLEPFTGQKIEVRRSTFVVSINGIPTGSEQIAEERDGLAKSLISILKNAGWKSPDTLLSSGLHQQGISVLILRGSSSKTIDAAKALVRALGEVPLVVKEPESVSDDLAKRSEGESAILPLPDKDTIILIVHPK